MISKLAVIIFATTVISVTTMVCNHFGIVTSSAGLSSASATISEQAQPVLDAFDTYGQLQHGHGMWWIYKQNGNSWPSLTDFEASATEAGGVITWHWFSDGDINTYVQNSWADWLSAGRPYLIISESGDYSTAPGDSNLLSWAFKNISTYFKLVTFSIHGGASVIPEVIGTFFAILSAAVVWAIVELIRGN